MTKENEQLIVNEKEAIQITIKHGYDGSELNTVTWKERGCLKPNRSMESLKRKLLTIYENVEIQGNGKKRKYILDNKKSKVTDRIYNYKGSVPSPEDEIMKEYIFNQLVLNKEKNNNPYKAWARILKFINPESYNINEMIQVLKDLHIGFPVMYNPKEAVSTFIQTITIRNKDIIQKSFQRLQKENRIIVHESFYYKDIEGNYIEIDSEEYNDLLHEVKTFLETKETTYYIYSQALTSLHKTKKMKRIIKELEDYLSTNFELKYFFKSFQIDIVDQTIIKEITPEEFEKAYYDRSIKLTIDRQNKKEYKDSLTFWRRFYLINSLTLLNFLQVKQIGDILKQENIKYRENVDDYCIDILAHEEEQKAEHDKRHTFGTKK